RHWNLLLH
nr:immunoglobulin heavy chain junction region [Mus musculus]